MTARLLAATLLATLNVAAAEAPAPAVGAVPSSTRAAIAASAFMAGHWIGAVEGHLSEEIWTEPAGGSMLGMWRLVADGQPRVLELLAITEESGSLVLRLRHFDARLRAREEKEHPLELRLVRAADGEVAFEGTHTDGGSLRLEYRRDGPDGLTAALLRGAKRDDFHYRRRAPR